MSAPAPPAPAPPAPAPAPPPSQQKREVWLINMRVDAATALARQRTLLSMAETFLERAGNGGTTSILRCILVVGDEQTTAPRITTSGATASDGVLLLDTSAATPNTFVLNMFFIFEGEGRVKRTILRSLCELDAASWWQHACTEVQACSLALLLSRLLEVRTSTIYSKWLGEEQKPLEYLRRRVADIAPEKRVTAGLDLLGPARRAPAQLPTPAALALLPGPPPDHKEAGPSEQPRPLPARVPHPEVRPGHQLASLLAWDGELSQAVAADRATKLLALLAGVMEENAVLKIEAASRAESEAKQVSK